MKLLLDECVDARFVRELPGHTVRTVPRMGWAGIPDGPLLHLAEKEFDVFITTDRNLEYQQNLGAFNIAVAVLCAPTNRLVDLKTLTPKLLSLLSTLPKRQATQISN